FQKRDDDKKSNDRPQFSDRGDRPRRSTDKFKDNRDNRGDSKQGSSFAKKRPSRPSGFNESGGNSGERSQGSSYSKPSNRTSRPKRSYNREEGSGDRNERKPFSKYSNRTSRPARSEEGGDTPKKNWRKSTNEGFRQDKPEFKGNRDNKFRSDRKHHS